MTEEYGKELRDYRYDIGYRMIELMEENEDLPIGNIYRLSEIMQEYCNDEGVVDDLKKDEYTWRPSAGYWRKRMKDITSYIRTEHKKYFGFMRDKGKLTGQWKFMTPEEWKYTSRRGQSDIGTRIETHNEKLDESYGKFNTKLPHLQEVPLLN